MKRLIIALIVLCIALCFIGIHSGCRSSKRHKSNSRSSYDSSSKQELHSYTETLTTEQLSKPIVVQPSGLSMQVNTDGQKQVQENEWFKLSYTAPTATSPGKISVEGKPKTIEAALTRSTIKKEHSAAQLQTQVKQQKEEKSLDKQTRYFPVLWAVVILIIVLLLFGYVKIKK